MINGKKLIISLTTYPARFEYLKRAFLGILEQTLIASVDSIVINLDDNLQPEQIDAYNEFKVLDPRIEVKVRDYKWKSANKLVWTYKDNPDAVIVCFDDDKVYPTECLAQLVDAWEKNPDCIIAQEINPSIVYNGRLEYVNVMDVKLGQKEFGKYLSNACLFPPRCFSEQLYDYDSFKYITNGMHDELWFWIVSTLNGTRCIGLNYTFSYEADGITFKYDNSALTHVNADPGIICGYNNRLNEKFGKELFDVVQHQFVDFYVCRENIIAICGNMSWINQLYNGFKVRFVISKDLARSWTGFLSGNIRKFQWNCIAVVGEDCIS